MIIAVDGPAAAGKGTIARALAQHFGYHFLDTGSLYRMVGLAVLEQGHDPRDAAAALAAASRSIPISRMSTICAPKRRRCRLDRRRHSGRAGSTFRLPARFRQPAPGAVLDGRDIGTVVCPDAEAKIFVTASPEVRARRRHAELAERGDVRPFETVLAEIAARDERDRARAHAPLVPAKDAYVLETSAMTREEALAAAIRFVEGRRK